MNGKKTGKRLLSWVLVLIMALSMLPLNVLADELGEKPDVVQGYYQDGEWVSGTNSATLPKGVDSVNKTAKRVGDNTYEVTLEVQMHTTTETQTSYAQAATVLVIDTSGSMSYCLQPEHEHTASCYTSTGEECRKPCHKGDVYTHLNGDTCIRDATTGQYYKANLICPLTKHTHKTGCGKGNDRLATAKTAAIDFLDSYSAGGAGRYVALVHFSTGADVVAEWQDVSNKQGYDAILTAISNLKANGGTNLEQGLDKAQGLLGNNAVANIASKNIIALTDGKPTYYNVPSKHDSKDKFGQKVYPDGDGQDCDKETFEATKNKAAEILAKDYSLYSICFGAANEEVTVPNTNTKISLLSYLNTYIAPGKTYSAGDFTGLKNAFDAISKDITTGLSSGTVHDSLPTGVTSTAIPSGAVGVNWDLKGFEKNENTEGPEGPEGNTTTYYTYTKTYTVKIDPTQIPEIQDGDYYPLNGPTTLTVGDGVTIDFPIPAGKVTLQKYKVTYSWSGLPEGTKETIPTDTTEYYAGDTVTIDSTYTDKSTVKVGHDTYTFSGWTVSPELSNGKMPASDVTASGTWKKTATDPTYKVTYSWSGLPEGATATIPTDTTEYYAGDTVTIDSTYTDKSTAKVGHDTYTFSGWDSSKLNDGKMPAENITITGTWKKTATDTYTVKFESNGGSTVADQKVNYNGKATKPTNPTKSGHTFAGWYTEDELTNKYDFNTSVTKNITLYAKWNAIYVPYYPPVPPTVKIEDDDALGLNTTDHFAYIIGYPDGTVQPGGQITRAEVATIFFRLLTDDVRDANLKRINSYTDVASNAWYNTAVSTLSSMGIITGYPDGTFRPNANITRAEFAAIAARFDPSGNKTAAAFSDILNHWAKDEISIAFNNSWVDGYPDGTFLPQRNISCAEAMTLVNRVLNRKPEAKDDLLPEMKVWTDNLDPNAWYYLAVQEATNSHYYKFKTNSKYEKWTELRETRDWTLLEK